MPSAGRTLASGGVKQRETVRRELFIKIDGFMCGLVNVQMEGKAFRFVWQGAEGPGGLGTPDSRVIAMRECDQTVWKEDRQKHLTG